MGRCSMSGDMLLGRRIDCLDFERERKLWIWMPSDREKS